MSKRTDRREIGRAYAFQGAYILFQIVLDWQQNDSGNGIYLTTERRKRLRSIYGPSNHVTVFIIRSEKLTHKEKRSNVPDSGFSVARLLITHCPLPIAHCPYQHTHIYAFIRISFLLSDMMV